MNGNSGPLTVLLTVAVLLLPLSASTAAEALQDELARCATIDSDSDRLTCYDKLSTVSPAPAVDADTKPAAATGESDIGAESVRSADNSAADEPEFSATVTKCRKDSNNRYTFYFENGQIWRQTGGKRLRFKECAFDVTITKDFFGYKMREDGEKRRIRVTRLQ